MLLGLVNFKLSPSSSAFSMSRHSVFPSVSSHSAANFLHNLCTSFSSSLSSRFRLPMTVSSDSFSVWFASNCQGGITPSHCIIAFIYAVHNLYSLQEKRFVFKVDSKAFEVIRVARDLV
eukprot:TRINITY_DN1621_c0_g1_i14.p2 TRINITY_DN1621_c0_g1~~TRINITY_DN1621_c0_g1_i14.p2  ORF type:complete len:119 (-),score=3.37 TRINITY_DN1621_c0_g1_i14:128-484(-)